MSLSWRVVQHYLILDAKATTWVGKTIDVRDFRNITVKIWTVWNSTLVVKAQGAIASASNEYLAPDFSSAQSVSNNWDYVKMIDLNSGNAIAGDTWFTTTWTDDFKLYEINVNALDYINFSVTARSAWSVTVEAMLSNNI
jgi:hypothetical protein